MRTIVLKQIGIFFALVGIAAIGALGLVSLLFSSLAWTGEFRSLAASFVFLLSFYGLIIAIYRIGLRLFPLPSGDIALASREETIYHIYLLSFLFLFYPLMKSNMVPVPLMRAIYLALGARLGPNTYSGGILFDPLFVEIGANTLIGQGALLIPHIIEGQRLAHFPIRIGHGVTIGANAVILSDVEIGDNAIIAIGAVVTKGSRVPAGEIWGGTPARPLTRNNNQACATIEV